jgi:hypothetical protein
MNAFQKYTAEVLPKFHPLFAGLVWAASARSEDETRHVLNHLLVERDPENDLITRIVATDGRRLHIHTYDAGLFDDDLCDQMLEPGLWVVVAKSAKQIVITRSDEDLTYPDWGRVNPDHNPTRTAAVNAQTVGIVSALTGNIYAVDFMRQACGFGAGAKSETVHITYGSESPTSPMVIEHELGRALLMPIRLDDEEAEDEKSATMTLPHLGVEDTEESDENSPELTLNED